MRKSPKLLSVFALLIIGGSCLCQSFFQRAYAATISSGRVTNLGIFVQFADSDSVAPLRKNGSPFRINDPDNIAAAEQFLNSPNPISMTTYKGTIQVPSIKTYYERQSYGKLSLTTRLFSQNSQVVTYRDEKNIGYYFPYNDANPDGYKGTTEMADREIDLAKRIITFANNNLSASGLSAADLDSNGDGIVDLLTFFIEPAVKIASDGTNAFSAKSGSMFWSHVRGSGGLGYIAGKYVANYALIYKAPIAIGSRYDVTELLTFSYNTGTYGTVAHEIGHLLGLKDLYRSDYGVTPKVSGPVEIYDLMGNTTASNPQNLSAYLTSESKNWHDPLPVIDKTTTNLTVSEPKFTDPSERRAYKIAKNSNDREYFIVEYYRPHDARDRYAGDSPGIIVYRVNENFSSAGNYHAFGSGDDHIFIFRPGETSLGLGAGNIYQAPLNLTRNTLGKSLSSSTAFDNKTIYYADGTNSGLIITVTSMSPDSSSVTFDVNFTDFTHAADSALLSPLDITKHTDNFLTGFNLGSDLSDLSNQLSAKSATFIEFKTASDTAISSGTIATGTKLSLHFNATVFAYTLVIRGDTNGDGQIQATDYVKVRNHIMGKSQLTGAYLKAADIDQNNEIQATDYVKIRNHIMGRSSISQK